MGAAAALLAVLPVIQAAEVWLFKDVVDKVLVPRDPGALPVLAAAFVALNLAAGVLTFGDEWLATWAGEHFVFRVRNSLFAHLLQLSPLQLGRQQTGDLVARLSGDVAAIEGFVVGGPSRVVEQGVRIVVFVGMLLWIDPVLTALAVVAAPLCYAIARRFSGAIGRAAREQRRRSGSLQGVAEEVLSALPQVQAASAEAREQRRLEAEGRAVIDAELRASRVIGLFRPLVDLTELAGALAVISVGAWALSTGRVSLGELLAFMTYLTQLYSPIRDLTDLAASASKAAAAGERIIELLEEEPAVVDGAMILEPASLTGVVDLEDVSFRYSPSDDWTLERFSLHAEPGTVTAIIGASGSGKSTLTALLLRLADPQRGSVRIDGHDIRSLSLESLRRNVGVLLQDSYLFDGTVAENVAYGSEAAAPSAIWHALYVADANEFVERLDGGLDHPVGPGGSLLSGGQRRRLALARALFEHRPVLVLDEYSAGLDAASSARVLSRLRAAGRTVLLITHDPAVSRCADRVVAMGRESTPEAA